MAECTVAPIKVISLPRLELLAAVTTARFRSNVRKELGSEGVWFWINLSVTLHWTKSQSDKWKPFVSNRAKEIQVLSSSSPTHHCPGDCSPTELLTRGISATLLKKVECGGKVQTGYSCIKISRHRICMDMILNETCYNKNIT